MDICLGICVAAKKIRLDDIFPFIISRKCLMKNGAVLLLKIRPKGRFYMANRITYNDWQKNAVYARYGGLCAICGCPVSKKKMTIDHKYPISLGGTNAIDNLQLVCWACNQAKSNMTMDEFFDKMARIFMNNKSEILQRCN